MAFVARNDQHGNEIMRVMLSTEPGKPTVASCQNLRINCVPQTPLTSCEGRHDHRHRFHYYAEDSQAWRQMEQKSHSVAEPIAQQEREKERDRTHKRLREKQSLSDDDSTAWNSVEINAHSTLVSARKSKNVATLRRETSTHFHSWLAEKNKKEQQQEENRRLAARQKDLRAEERARLAHEKYRSWLNAKSSTKVNRAKSDLSSLLTSTSTSRQSLPADEAKRRLRNWKQEKLEKLKAQRQQRKEVEEKQQLMESARRELSAEAWEQWMDAAKTKPRPVPMGQGLDSLRGSLAPHYTNPNEWQPIVGSSRRQQQSQHSPQSQQSQQSQQSPQSPQSQSTTARNRPDYERLERLAQPRRKQSRPTLNESLKSLEENSADKSGSQLGDKSRVTDAETNNETLRNQSISTEKVEEQVELEDPSQLLQPRGKPIIWSKNNAQRVRELREVIHPQEAEMPRQLRDDQVEQLRKHQDLQNSKILPRKYQMKREKLREKLKAWVEEGKLLPERLAVDEDTNLVKMPKQETPKEISQRESNTNESKGQRSEDQMQSTARKSVSTELRARSTDPTKLLKLKDKEREKESKGTPKSRPWR